MREGHREVGREGQMEGGREGGREGQREGGREGVREEGGSCAAMCANEDETAASIPSGNPEAG